MWCRAGKHQHQLEHQCLILCTHMKCEVGLQGSTLSDHHMIMGFSPYS